MFIVDSAHSTADIEPKMGSATNTRPTNAANEQSSLRVLLLIDNLAAEGRAGMRGVMRYASEQPHWQLVLPMGPDLQRDPEPSLFTSTDAMILRTLHTTVLRRVKSWRKPMISMLGRYFANNEVPVITTDGGAIARTAFDHLRDSGFNRMGFFGVGDLDWLRHRCNAFTDQCREHNIPLTCLLIDHQARTARDARAAHNKLLDWLDGLVKPIGIFTPKDVLSRSIVECCKTLGLSVPDDVAVIGSDNDQVMCEGTTPSLSSVDPGMEAIGYRAAQRIDEALSGKPIPAFETHPPEGVIQRDSTDVRATDDAMIAKALRLIRSHVSDGLTAEQLATEFPLSRSSFDRRFRAQVGRSPMQQILHSRVEAAKTMLWATDHSPDTIALACGFASTERFYKAFKRATGITPRTFRLQRDRR